MNKYHQEVLTEIKKEAEQNPHHSSQDLSAYTGTHHPRYPLNNTQRRTIVKNWIKSHPQISLNEFISLFNSLYQGKSCDEKMMAGMMLSSAPKLRKEVKPIKLDTWLDELEGWEEIDSLCQSSFTAQDLLTNWNVWKKQIRKFNQDKNISKRRASLVLLTKPVRESDDQRLAQLSLKNIDTLKNEKAVLITKAISWLLRSLIKHHPQLVEDYLKENSDSLPKIAIRETKNKLLTGKK